DLIFELSPHALVELIRQQLMLNGVNYDPPAEISAVNLDMEGRPAGEVHFVLTDLSVSLGTNAQISITFAFARGSILGRPGRPNLFGLEGTITIHSRLTLDPVPMQPTRRALTLHLRRIERAGRVVESSTVNARARTSGEAGVLIGVGV